MGLLFQAGLMCWVMYRLLEAVARTSDAPCSMHVLSSMHVFCTVRHCMHEPHLAAPCVLRLLHTVIVLQLKTGLL